MSDTLESLRDSLRDFTLERDWHRFHSPKNLAMALAVEAAEMMEIFQWTTEVGSRAMPSRKLDEAEDEIGDVLIYLVRLADELGIDPVQAASVKLEKNRDRYPADQVRGSSKKYTEYGVYKNT